MGKYFEKSVADAKGADKKDFLRDFTSSMHVMSSDELKTQRNPIYQYII